MILTYRCRVKDASCSIRCALRCQARAVSLSNGFKIAAPKFYRQEQKQLGVFQRRGQKVRARALAAKIANRRQHFLHVVSHGLVRHYGEIYGGDVSAKQLAKTRMAKSVHDAGWSMLRNMLSYKSIATGGVMRCRALQFPNVLGLWVHSRKPPERVGCACSEAVEM